MFSSTLTSSGEALSYIIQLLPVKFVKESWKNPKIPIALCYYFSFEINIEKQLKYILFCLQKNSCQGMTLQHKCYISALKVRNVSNQKYFAMKLYSLNKAKRLLSLKIWVPLCCDSEGYKVCMCWDCFLYWWEYMKFFIANNLKYLGS